ncbi:MULTISPECIES: glycine zipper domain-containing protein [Amycolatopsis]|uniref:glycine zipper domain-containing protein n=1 Tax=Amycolatopsis TaxID=1813 RepID=UPI0033A46B58
MVDDYTVGRVATGAAVGAAVGSVVPGVGTAVGAGVGAVVGGLVGLMSTPEAEHHEANIAGRTIDARQIWEQISPGNATSLVTGANAANSLKSVHEERGRLIQQINDLMDNAWKGMASGQAQAGAHPLGIWLQDSATNLGKSHTYLNDQAAAFDTVKSKVQEVPAQPPDGNFLDGINPMSDVDEQIEQYNQRGKANVDAFNAYYQASMNNAGGMPQYTAWQGNVFSGGGVPGGVPGGVGGAGNMPSASGMPGDFKPASTGDLPQFNSTNPSATVPKTPTPAGFTPGTGSGGYNPAFDGTTAAGYTPSSTSGFGPGGGAGAGIGGGAGAGGGGVGASGFGAGFGPGAGIGTGATAGTGAGPGGAGAGGAGGRSGRGAGRAGMAGAPGMGGRGGHGNGEEDEEHENKYMVGDDPNELFGTDELTAPPVIGE